MGLNRDLLQITEELANFTLKWEEVTGLIV
jgi:hypothetical protein